METEIKLKRKNRRMYTVRCTLTQMFLLGRAVKNSAAARNLSPHHLSALRATCASRLNRTASSLVCLSLIPLFGLFIVIIHAARVARQPSGQRAGLRRRRARVQIAAATLSVSLRQTVHTNRASVHQAAKLAAALLRVAGVTAGLAESNGSLPPGL